MSHGCSAKNFGLQVVFADKRICGKHKQIYPRPIGYTVYRLYRYASRYLFREIFVLWKHAKLVIAQRYTRISEIHVINMLIVVESKSKPKFTYISLQLNSQGSFEFSENHISCVWNRLYGNLHKSRLTCNDSDWQRIDRHRVTDKIYCSMFLPVRDARHDFCHDSVRLRTVIRLTYPRSITGENEDWTRLHA